MVKESKKLVLPTDVSADERANLIFRYICFNCAHSVVFPTRVYSQGFGLCGDCATEALLSALADEPTARQQLADWYCEICAPVADKISYFTFRWHVVNGSMYVWAELDDAEQVEDTCLTLNDN